MQKNLYTFWLLAIAYSLAYILFPWAEIQGYEFYDLLNYEEHIVYLREGGQEATVSGLKWLLSEPLWRYIIILLGMLFDDPRTGLYIVSFLIVLFYIAFIFRRVDYYIGMILLINPLSLVLFMSQLRSAFAFALLLLAYDLASKRWATVLLIMATFIHVSVPLLLIFYYLLYRLNQLVEPKKYYLITIITALFVALFMKYGLDIILRFLGDRHAGYDSIIEAASLSYSIVWFLIALVIAPFATFENEKERVIAGYAILMMTFFFFSSVLGMFAQRYVALTIPFIIVSVSYLPKHFKQGTYIAFFLYNLLQFVYWLGD